MRIAIFLSYIPLVACIACTPSGNVSSYSVQGEKAEGFLIVEINDPETESRMKNGKLILTGPDDKVRDTLPASERDKRIDAGPYKVRVEGADGVVVDTPAFMLKKDGKVVVRVSAVLSANPK